MVGSRLDSRIRRHRVRASLRLGSTLLATVVLTVGLGIRPVAAASTIVATPLPTGTTRSDLTDVTCAGTTMCWAVGTVNVDGEDSQYLIQRWNGTSWSIAKQGSSDAHTTSGLQGATCTSATNCWAVGGQWPPLPWLELDRKDRPLVLRWNGTTWTGNLGPLPTGSRSAQFNDVACTSATNCWAVGGHTIDNVSPPRRMMARWNGTAWSVVTGQTPTSGGASTLESVTCASSTVCWAVGNTGGSNRLVLRWNGSAWSTVTPPLPTGTTQSSAEGVTCSSATACWIVGVAVVSGAARRLVLRWNGSAWSLVPTALPTGTTASLLDNVTCFSATACWAVGAAVKSGVVQPLVVRWNGTAWASVSAPAPSGATRSQLTGVACTGALACWAVGDATVAGSWRRLVIRFTP